ncbi:hypothetical protein G7Y89_g15029 [Cudoniella acicularis]|uniref:Uncharacterized protein n=1 Tax=Cudoniella acicularis TaxID=354080 RepID=A0A8H4VPW0_9HELO|nr:hypothetical protein G7Y89_g15029 [Cudoniella acicularis]
MASTMGNISNLSAERNDSDIKNIDETEAQQTSTRNSGVDRHNLSDDDDLPPLEEIFKPKTASALSNQGQKRKPAELTNPLDSDGDKSPPRKRCCDQTSRLAAASPGTTRPLKIIDLTTDTEHCALCPNVLGEGSDIKARMLSVVDVGARSANLHEAATVRMLPTAKIEFLLNVATLFAEAVLNGG